MTLFELKGAYNVRESLFPVRPLSDLPSMSPLRKPRSTRPESGWAIYNASPSLPFTFPWGLTLGGWLAGGIAWHISVMWVLFADGLAYLAYGTISGHFWRDLRPTGPRPLLRDLGDALRFRLPHRLGHYNAVQRLLYTAVILCTCVQVLTGLSI